MANNKEKQNDSRDLAVQHAATVSASVSIIYITAITIIGDLHKPLKLWYADMFSHHWIGKGITSIVLFALLTLVLKLVIKKANENSLSNQLWILSTITAFSSVLLFMFFVYETLHA